jgi:hypothetical protein
MNEPETATGYQDLNCPQGFVTKFLGKYNKTYGKQHVIILTWMNLRIFMIFYPLHALDARGLLGYRDSAFNLMK